MRNVKSCAGPPNAAPSRTCCAASTSDPPRTAVWATTADRHRHRAARWGGLGDPQPQRGPAVLASFGQRLGAYLLDVILLNVAVFGGLFLMGFLWGLVVGLTGGDPSTETTSTQDTVFGAVFVFAALVLPLLYWIIGEGRWGKTVGKKVVGIRVVDDQRQPITYGKTTGRTFGRLLSGLPLALGYLWAAWDDDHQTWHDKMAGTLVIADR